MQARTIIERHQGFNGDRLWHLCRFADRWAYHEESSFGLIEAGTDPGGCYWAWCKSKDDRTQSATGCASLVESLVALSGRLSQSGVRWVPPVESLAEVIEG
jgi:hypothetical protein